MKEIRLYCGLIAFVDDEDFDRLIKHKWFKSKGKTGFSVYASTKINGKNVKMHRLILGAESGVMIDHVDHNGLNNQKDNLRKCNNIQNSRNQSKRKSLFSQYKGVCRKKNRKKGWQAGITVNYKRINLGAFHSEIEAAIAYNNAALEIFGEFARINEIPKAGEPVLRTL